MIGRRAVLVLAVGLLLITAGCLGGLPSENGADADDGATGDGTNTPDAGDTDTPDAGDTDTSDTRDTDDEGEPGAGELLGAALDAREGIDTVQGVMTTTTASDEQSITVTQEVWLRPPDEQRLELVEADAPQASPTVTVTNGTATWLYFEAENRAVRADNVQSSLGAAASTLAGQLQLDPSNVNATRNGTATVASRDVHVVEFTASTEEATYDSGTVWIDRETNFPLKQETMLSAGGQEVTFGYEFEEVTLGEQVDDDVFTFTPPEDAELREFSEFSSEQYDSVEDAEAAVPFDLPEPDPPEGYTFETAVAGETLQGWSASLQYINGTGMAVTVMVSESAMDATALVDSEPVEIGGVDATTATFGDNVQIEWTDDDLVYRVIGNTDEPGKEALIGVAESIVE